MHGRKLTVSSGSYYVFDSRTVSDIWKGSQEMKNKSRWSNKGIRYSPARNVEDSRWQKVNGKWRFEIDDVNEVIYCQRRRERRGFFRGAFIPRLIRKQSAKGTRWTVTAVIAVAMSACSIMPTHAVFSPIQHVSHPLAGKPFGPASEEDELNQVNGGFIWKKGNWQIDQRLGYKLGNGGFFGPELTYYGSVDYIIPLGATQ